MRISDWSSDVCSSDLTPFFRPSVERYRQWLGVMQKHFETRRRVRISAHKLHTRHYNYLKTKVFPPVPSSIQPILYKTKPNTDLLRLVRIHEAFIALYCNARPLARKNTRLNSSH